MEVKEEQKGGYQPMGEELESFNFLTNRAKELMKSRKSVYGYDIEKLWRWADRDYRLEEIRSPGKKYFDDELGWRTTIGKVDIGSAGWQNRNSATNPFVKIQTALSILVDRIPDHELWSQNEKYEAQTQLMKALVQNNWGEAKSKSQLKLFVYNLAKYGFAVGRTYHRLVEREVRDLVEYNPGGKSKYKKKMITDYDDVYRECLDPWNVWVDDMARPYDDLSCRDWMWRKVMSKDEFDARFGDMANSKYVQAKGGIEMVKNDNVAKKEMQEKKLIEVIFYENRPRDKFMVMANRVLIMDEPLPYDHKQLSCWYTHWNLRHQETVYGVGLPEIMRQNKMMLEKVLNMTMDQLVLSIYKMFFYTGTDQLDGDGKIKIQPGVGKQVLDPKITWLDVPGPGAESWKGIEFLQKKLDEDSAISKTLEGEVTGKTAFEVAQAKESSLKRLKTPLWNVEQALQADGEMTISLIQQVYSIPKVEHLVDDDKIAEYIQEVDADPAFYFVDQEDFYAKRYREVQLTLEKNEFEQYIPTDGKNFFRILPKGLRWKGQIRIKPMSIISSSREIEKAQKLEMANLIVPLLAQPVELVMKSVKQILKIYNENPKDWLPDLWLQGGGEPERPDLFVSRGGQPQGGEQVVPGKKTLQKGVNQPGRVVPTTKTGGIKSTVAKAMKAINPFAR